MSDQTKKMLASFGRVFLACLGVGLVAVLREPMGDGVLTAGEVQAAAVALPMAVLGAAALTGANWLGSWDTRFGRHAAGGEG